MTLDAFKDLFKFDKDRAYQVGIERECFVTDHNGVVVPKAHDVLRSLETSDGWPRSDIGYELSACQLEMRAGPCELHQIGERMRQVRGLMEHHLDLLGLGASYREVAPAHMPLDVYPDPTGRYQRITKSMPRSVLQAACRIIGTHVHVGMPDHETALRTYNSVMKNAPGLRLAGDHSEGERLRLYHIVSPYASPVPFASWECFYEHALKNGYEFDPRKNWMEIRISAHGTIEFRLFGASESDEENLKWIKTCRSLCLTCR